MNDKNISFSDVEGTQSPELIKNTSDLPGDKELLAEPLLSLEIGGNFHTSLNCLID
jgi:hypothetical protein